VRAPAPSIAEFENPGEIAEIAEDQKSEWKYAVNLGRVLARRPLKLVGRPFPHK
jgi:hypothetical protein